VSVTAFKSVKRRRATVRGPGYGIIEFARMFDLSVSSVRAAIKNGEITAIKFNGVPRIPRSEKYRFMEIWGEEQAQGERPSP